MTGEAGRPGVTTISPLVRKFSARARDDPFFLGHQLDEAARRHGWTDDGLMAALKCDADTLVWLCCCRRLERAAQVRHVGAHPDFGGRFDEEALAGLLRLA